MPLSDYEEADDDPLEAAAVSFEVHLFLPPVPPIRESG